MHWLEVPILCHTPETSSLKELNLDVNDDLYDIRTGSINLDKITGFYPTADRKNTIVAYSDTEFEIVIPYNQFKTFLT